MPLRKYSLFIGLLVMVSTIALMSHGIFNLSQRAFEWNLMHSYILLGLIHGVIALGFAYFKKGVGLILYFLGYIGGFVVLLDALSKPNEGFLQIAALFSAFIIMIVAVFAGIIVELFIALAKKKMKKPEDPHLS